MFIPMIIEPMVQNLTNSEEKKQDCTLPKSVAK